MVSKDIYDYECLFIEDMMAFASIANRNMAIFVDSVNKLSCKIATEILGLELGYVEDLAIKYANLGLIFNEHNKPDTLEGIRKEIFFRHISVSEQFLRRKSLEAVADICLHHHELPNGLGRLKVMKYPPLSDAIAIAERFVSLTTPTDGVYYTPEETATIIEDTYKSTALSDKVKATYLLKLL